MSTQPDKTLRSRFECKYLVTEDVAQGIVLYTKSHLDEDYYTSQQESRQYPVHSLYIDSANHELYSTTIKGLKNRFKLRIRGYDSNPDSPLFVEVKRRADRVILKRRTLVNRKIAMAILTRTPMPTDAPSDNPEFSEFRNLYTRLGAGPAVYVSYMREAYDAKGGDPVRVTFDRSLLNAPADYHDPFNFDAKNWKVTPQDKVILELKYTDACPYWLEDVVQYFNLSRCSVAKYIMCLDEAMRPDDRSLHYG